MGPQLRLGLMMQMALGCNVREQMRNVGETRGIGAHAAKEWYLLVGGVGGCARGGSWCHLLLPKLSEC